MDFNTARDPGGHPRRAGGAAGPGPGGGFRYTDPARSFLDALRGVLFSPNDFFRGMPRRGGLANPLIFAATCALIGAVLGGAFDEVARHVPGLGFFATGTGFLSGTALYFVWTMAGLAVGTGVYHLLVGLVVGRGNAGLGATFGVLSYALAVQVVGWLPLVNLLAGVYALYLCAFGFREVHSTTYGRAAAIVALPILLLVLVSFLVGMGAAFLLSSG